MPTDYWACGMLVAAYHAINDDAGRTRTAREVVARTEKIIAQDPTNGSAMGFAIGAFIALKENDRARDLIARALLLDPDNANMRYNLACGLIQVGDTDAALDHFEQLFERLSVELVNWSKTDADLDPIREHPRFKAMVAKAEARIAAAQRNADR
jgi:adenylate cyclase